MTFFTKDNLEKQNAMCQYWDMSGKSGGEILCFINRPPPTVGIDDELKSSNVTVLKKSFRAHCKRHQNTEQLKK